MKDARRRAVSANAGVSMRSASEKKCAWQLVRLQSCARARREQCERRTVWRAERESAVQLGSQEVLPSVVDADVVERGRGGG